MSNEGNPIRQLVVDYLSSRSNLSLKPKNNTIRVLRQMVTSNGRGHVHTSNCEIGTVHVNGSLVRVWHDGMMTEFDMVSPGSLRPLMKRLRKM